MRRYELRRDGDVEKLEKLPMELLILLVQRRGELVSRGDIVERLWGRDVFVDADAAVNTAIRKVRRALGDDPDHPRFVETVVGKGYRFVGPITVTGAEAPAPTGDLFAARRRGRRALAAAALVLVAVALALGALVLGRGRGSGSIESVAVLPFENDGGGPEAEYLTDGLTDSLINRLSRVRQLRVIARASVFRYKGQHPDLPGLARELRVRALVTGRVSPRPEGLAVSVELIDAGENKQLWGARFDWRSHDLEAAHDELATEIADKLRLELTPDERQRLARRDTADPEAYRLYLRGRFLSNERTQPALLRAVSDFEEAIRRDPAFALAYSGLADAHCTMATCVPPVSQAAAGNA